MISRCFKARNYIFAFLAMCSVPVAAQPNAPELSQIASQLRDLQKQLTELQGVVLRQQNVISTLQSENQQLKSATQPVVAAAPSPAVTQFNPDIGMVGDFVGTSSQSSEDEEGNDRLSVREIELTVGHDIDPYSRFDSVITFSDFEAPDIEEAFVSYWGLPSGTTGRLGRFRPKVGIQSAQHRDQLETVDEPLVIQRYLGVEGLFRTGIELGNFVPVGWDNPTHEIVVGMLEGGVGEGGELLGETRRVPTFYSRLRSAYELSDYDYAAIGGTYLRGSSSSSFSDGVNLFIADLTYTRRFDSIRRLKLQAELFLQDRSAGIEPSAESEIAHAEQEESEFRRHPYGLYALADYRFSDRFSIGSRFDYVQPVMIADSDTRSFESAFNGYVTFHQSEFARWRFQYQYANLVDGDHDNRFFLQGTFAIGVHKHSLQ